MGGHFWFFKKTWLTLVLYDHHDAEDIGQKNVLEFRSVITLSIKVVCYTRVDHGIHICTSVSEHFSAGSIKNMLYHKFARQF